MKKRQAQTFLRKHLLPDFPGWEARGSLMYAWAGRHLLCGVNLGGSAFDRTSFYVHAFVLPLFKVTEHLHYVFGERIGPGWEMHPGEEEEVGRQLVEALKDEGMAWIRKVDTLERIANSRSFHEAGPDDPHVLETVAGANILLGRHAEASAMLDRLREIVAPYAHEEAMRAVFDRADTLQHQLRSAPQAAIAQLHEWERQTLANLKLPDTRPEVNHDHP